MLFKDDPEPVANVDESDVSREGTDNVTAILMVPALRS